MRCSGMYLFNELHLLIFLAKFDFTPRSLLRVPRASDLASWGIFLDIILI